MNIKWYGHACFRIRFDNNTTVLTDPYNIDFYHGDVRYSKDFEHTDIITISHHHKDHDYIPFEDAHILDKIDNTKINDIKFSAFFTYHDEKKGKERGNNILFLMEYNNVRLLHLGDLGEIPNSKVMEQLKNIDILFIPTGETFTFEIKKAKEFIDYINPNIIFPMHYKTDKIDFPLTKIDRFIEMYDADRILYTDKSEIDIDNILNNKIIIMNSMD